MNSDYTYNFNTDVSHKTIKTFHQLNISNADYLRALDKLNFLQPTPIQILSIPLAQAKAGTGKTLAFSSILIERLLRIKDEIQSDSDPQVLILLPTRELAIQVFEFIEQLLSTMRQINPNLLPHVKCGIFIGGLPLQDDRRNLKIQHVKIIIGTIGRIIALIKENSLALSSINTFVMDEADKLMGQKDFYKHISYIFEALNKSNISKTSVPVLQNINNSENTDSKGEQTHSNLGLTVSQVQQSDQKIEQPDEKIEQSDHQVEQSDGTVEKIDGNEGKAELADEKQRGFEIMQRRKKNMKSRVQYLAFSATYPEDLKTKIEKLMVNSTFVDAIALQNISGSQQEGTQNQNEKENRDLNLENIVQYRIDIKPHQTLSITKQKISAVIDILKNVTFNQAIIFYNDKIKGENIFSELKAQNYTAIFIHGDQSQADRIKIMNQIRRNKTQIIISTDLLSRGIDISTIDVVINYDMPSSIETYQHRIGRTGRYGRFGVSALLVQQNEESFIQSNIIHFCRLQDLPLDYSQINQKLQQKLNNISQIQHQDSNNQQLVESSETSSSQLKNKKVINKPAPHKYHHEFTQGIIREEVDVNEQFYDESNFKYFKETSLSPIILNGENELSGSMFSDDQDVSESDDNDNLEEEEEEEEEDEEFQEDGNNNNKNQGNVIKISHKCKDQSEWGFLTCQTCYDFLMESQKYLNKQFQILQYFKITNNE